MSGSDSALGSEVKVITGDACDE
ncbi:hypothetical protein E2C01_074654 [Portunus trituberculatus]|uniref:Uncharacterized protein n=1 Tax=Portunus trituberculatus TaxID=210409 RepID=A0A5B7IEU7_PORTR|nr:hypothetical protein [Portunus trituberculatus]